jgi:hypothetical protein
MSVGGCFLSFQLFYVRQSTFVAHLCAQEVLLTDCSLEIKYYAYSHDLNNAHLLSVMCLEQIMLSKLYAIFLTAVFSSSFFSIFFFLGA